MIGFTSRGSTRNIERYLLSRRNLRIESALRMIGEHGVVALAAATPKGETGMAASSWSYKIEVGRDVSRVIWSNSNIEDGFPVVIGMQYGHATGTGGYVAGQDFINAALKPVFDRFSDAMGRAVKS